MKKVFIIFLLTFFAISQIEVKGQEVLGGAGIVIGTSSFSTFGIGIRGEYRLNEVWGFVPNFNFWFNKKEGSGSATVKYGLTTLNFDAHYLFDVAESVKVYPLAGLNITIAKVKNDFTSEKISDTSAGLNIGGGAEYAFTDSFRGYGEIKYVISSADQLVIALGVLFRFKE